MILHLRSGYDPRTTLNRDGSPANHHAFRPMTIAEAKALSAGQTVDFVGNDGTARHIKINGRVRTWKRDAERVEVPVKYGLYEYATFRSLPHDGIMERLIVPIP